MTRVSVIIPAYNAENFVAEAVESVLAQSMGDVELIVVDDGSTDGTRDLTVRFSMSGVRCLFQENRGLPAARNAGIRAAKSEYLAFLDADDCWLPPKLALQVQLLDSHPEVGLVYCSAVKVRDGGVCAEMRAAHRGRVVRQLLTVDNIVAGSASAVLIRRECFDRVGLFDETRRVFEDWDMWLRIARYYPFDYVPDRLVRIRVHGDSMQHQYGLMKAGVQSFFDGVLTDPELAHEVSPVERRVRSLSHFLLGRVCCNAGEIGEARRHLLRSIGFWPLQTRAWAYLYAALLGRRGLARLRAIRSRAAGLAAAPGRFST